MGDVLVVACLQLQVYVAAAQVDVEPRPFVVDRDDVGALFGNDAEYAEELSRFVREFDGKVAGASVRDKSSFDDASQDGNIYVAALFPTEPLWA